MSVDNDILLSCFYNEEVFQTKVVEKIKTLILYPITFSENRAVYEIMLKYMVEPERPQIICCSFAHCMLDN